MWGQATGNAVGPADDRPARSIQNVGVGQQDRRKWRAKYVRNNPNEDTVHGLSHCHWRRPATFGGESSVVGAAIVVDDDVEFIQSKGASEMGWQPAAIAFLNSL